VPRVVEFVEARGAEFVGLEGLAAVPDGEGREADGREIVGLAVFPHATQYVNRMCLAGGQDMLAVS